MRFHHPKLYNMAEHFPFEILLLSNEQTFIYFFPITAYGVVRCGGRKKSPYSLSIVQIIFYICGVLRAAS